MSEWKSPARELPTVEVIGRYRDGSVDLVHIAWVNRANEPVAPPAWWTEIPEIPG